jgi:hypothetical protein
VVQQHERKRLQGRILRYVRENCSIVMQRSQGLASELGQVPGRISPRLFNVKLVEHVPDFRRHVPK